MPESRSTALAKSHPNQKAAKRARCRRNDLSMTRFISSLPTGTAAATAMPPLWTLFKRRATCGESGVTLDLGAPGHGLAVPVDGARLAAPAHQLLGIDLRLAGQAAASSGPSEQWVRGSDCTAIYEPSDERALRATVMWRQWPAPTTGQPLSLAVWEVVVSAQTALLQSDPTLGVVSQIARAGEVVSGRWLPGGMAFSQAPTPTPTPVPVSASASASAAAAGLLVRTGAGRSVLVLAHPAEEQRLEAVSAADTCRVTCSLFSQPVEKGVLLRSRVLAAIGPETGDTTWAAEVAASFAASPPVLST